MLSRSCGLMVFSFIYLLIFCLVFLLTVERGGVKSPPVTVDLSISLSGSVRFHYTSFASLSACTFRITILVY